jgi:hypothetical protein
MENQPADAADIQSTLKKYKRSCFSNFARVTTVLEQASSQQPSTSIKEPMWSFRKSYKKGTTRAGLINENNKDDDDVRSINFLGGLLLILC